MKDCMSKLLDLLPESKKRTEGNPPKPVIRSKLCRTMSDFADIGIKCNEYGEITEIVLATFNDRENIDPEILRKPNNESNN